MRCWTTNTKHFLLGDIVARGQRRRAIEAGLERLLEALQDAMGKLRDWLERCERRSRPVAALPSQDDGVMAVLSPLHPLNPISLLNPANPSWSDSKPLEPDATALPYDPADRHGDAGHSHDSVASHSFDMAAQAATAFEALCRTAARPS